MDGGRGRGRWWRPTPPPHHRAQQKLTPSEGVGPSSLRHLSCQCGLFTWEGENGGRSKSLTQHSISYHDGDDCHHKCDQGKIGCHLFLLKVSFISRFFSYFRKQFLICLNKCNDCSFALFESLFTFHLVHSSSERPLLVLFSHSIPTEFILPF